MPGIEKLDLSDFKLGWIVGDFLPALVSSKEIEVAVKYFHAGETEPTHKQIIATEITVVVNGKIRLGGICYESGDIIRINPGIFADFEAITDSAVVCIKYPSLPNDKVLA